MKIGTKSVLFGAHQFLIHPLFLALAWWQLYGFPWDPRLWVAFFVHDIGYLGKPNMDGEEGEMHPFTGAKIMGNLFDYRDSFGHVNVLAPKWTRFIAVPLDRIFGHCPQGSTWYCFTFYHSRFLAKRYHTQFTRLCVADKLAICLEPWWLYLPRVILTGEVKEYMALAGGMNGGKYVGGKHSGEMVAELERKRTPRVWHSAMTKYMRAWIATHKDGAEDTWTPKSKHAVNDQAIAK